MCSVPVRLDCIQGDVRQNLSLPLQQDGNSSIYTCSSLNLSSNQSDLHFKGHCSLQTKQQVGDVHISSIGICITKIPPAQLTSQVKNIGFNCKTGILFRNLGQCMGLHKSPVYSSCLFKGRLYLPFLVTVAEASEHSLNSVTICVPTVCSVPL